MKLLTVTFVAACAVISLAGCKKSANPSSPAVLVQPTSQPQTREADIRAAIQEHLAHDSNLNLRAFDTDVKGVTIQGDHAQAQVEFRMKNGSLAMQMSYQLAKSAGNWAVIESNHGGNHSTHSPVDQTPVPGATDAPGGASHSPADIIGKLNGTVGGSSPTLPPGHPPITSNSNR